MPTINKDGLLIDSKVLVKRYPGIEHGKLNGVHAIVVHQTDAPTAHRTFNAYAAEGHWDALCHERARMNALGANFIPWAILAVVAAISSAAIAGDPPDSIYGNYHGAGQCPPDASRPCIDTGTLDNLFIQRFDKTETDMERQAREFHRIPRADARLAIRILRDHGHSCAFEGEAVWTGDHLAFKDEPPAARTVYSRCDLQLWFKDGSVTLKDPRNECTCSGGKRRLLEGRRFKRGPDQLLAAPKKSATPPPATIFGKYTGTGKCATDERRSDVCKENKSTDYIVIEPSDKADARVSLVRAKRPSESEDYFCLRKADAVWLGNHLAYVEEMADSPGRQRVTQFWFKNGTVVVHPLWRPHCGAAFLGTLFEKPPAQPKPGARN